MPIQDLPLTWPPSELGLFRTIGVGLEYWNDGTMEWCGVRPAANWLCFAQQAPPARRPPDAPVRPSLALFRIFRPLGTWPCPSRAELGLFVQPARVGRRRQTAGWAVRPQLCLQSAIRNPQSAVERLGSFRTFVPRPTPLGPRPTRPRRELASFRIIRNPQSDNSASGGRRLPGAVPAIRNRKIGFVLHDYSPPRHGGHRAAFSRSQNQWSADFADWRRFRKKGQRARRETTDHHGFPFYFLNLRKSV